MTDWQGRGFAALCGLALGGTAVAVFAQGQGAAPASRAQVEQIVRDYILANPEIIPEAMKRLEARQAASAVDANRVALETPYANAWAGAADADVTLVEFYDYACGYCRAAVPDIERLLREDSKLKVVYRELPVLGPSSDEAARLSLAVARGSGFRAFHDGLYARGALSPQKLNAAAAAAGLDAAEQAAARTDAAATREIDQNITLARALSLTGTPSFVVGDQVLQGAVGYEALKAAVAAARASARRP